jgi:hypothetical protein|tara:strand:- start:117 stop:509 length:393 start_codon:yes stop_codon:yes gene_type:complete
MSFAKDLDKITLNLSGYAENMVRATLFNLSYRIIKESPVDTGRFRGNWQASVNTPKVTQLKRKDRTGTSTITAVNNVLEKFSMGQTFYLTNNLPYARRLEYGSHSKQAPNGFLRINVMRVQSELEKARKR